MAIRAIDGFDNLIPIPSAIGTTTIPVVNSPYLYKTDTYGGKILKEDGWLKVVLNAFTSNANRTAGLTRPLSPLATLPAASMMLFGGFRYRAQNVPTTAIVLSSGNYSTVSYVQVLLYWSELVTAGAKADVEYYIEWCIDATAKLFRRWMDGVELPPVTLSTSTLALITGSTLGIVYGANAGFTAPLPSIYSFWIKDIYILEKLETGPNNGRLGPQKVVSLDVASVSGPWTASSGTAVDVLNAPFPDAASIQTPFLTSDELNTPLEIKLAAPAIVGKVNGVSIALLTKRDPGVSAILKTSVTADGKTTDKKELSLSVDFTFTSPTYLSDQTPDNKEWSTSKLRAAVLKLEI